MVKQKALVASVVKYGRGGHLVMLQDHLPVHGPPGHVVDISRVDPPLRQGLGI